MRPEVKEKLDKIKATQNMVAYSAYIQVAQSALYDFAPVRCAVLKEIAFMQMTSEDSKYMEDAPPEYKENRIGWCWASQETLALRCRCSEKYVQESVKVFEDDGVIITRSWIDSNNHEHLEYHVKEDIVQAHQREKGAKPMRKTNRVYKPNRGSFKRNDGRIHGPAAKNSQPSFQNSQPTPENSQPSSQQLSANSAQNSQPMEMAESAAKGVSQEALHLSGGKCSGVFQQDGESGSVPPSAGRPSPSASVIPSAEQVKSDEGSLAQGTPCSVCWRTDGTHHKRCTEVKPKARQQGEIVGAFKPPLPNRKSSPALFKRCYDAAGKWYGGKVPSCPRCGSNLQPNEYHVSPDYNPGMDAAAYKAHGYDVTICKGYTPKFKPVDERQIDMDDAREDRRELIANARKQRSKPECKRCGTPLQEGEGIEFEPHECPGYMSL